MFECASAYPTVQRGGIRAVAMATPKITEAMVPFLVRAIIKAKPPKKAINTSRISGLTRAKSSLDSSRSGKRAKKRNAVSTLSNTMTPKLTKERRNVARSLIAKETPTPRTGPIKGAINIAPMTTAVELAFKPMEARKIEQINTQAVAPRKEISSCMA